MSTYKYISNVAYYNTNLLTLKMGVSFFFKAETTNQKPQVVSLVALYAIGGIQ
jgi:hypothetical protein